MRKVLKWLGIVLGSPVGLVVLAVVALNIVASVRVSRTEAGVIAKEGGNP